MMKLGVMAAVSVMAAVAAGRDTAIYSGKLTSAMNANQFAITNLATPVASGDAVNKGYVDSIGGVTPSAVTGVVTGVVADWALKPNERPEGMSTNTVAWIVTNEVERTIGGVYSVSNTPAGAAINASAYGDPTWDGSQWVMYGSSAIPDFTQWRDPWDGENDIPTRWTYDDTYSDVYLIGFIGGATVVKENALGMASTNYVANYVASHTSPLDTQAVTNIVEGYNYVTAAVTNGLAANYAAVSNAAMGAVQKAEPFLDGWPTKYVTIQDQGHPEYQPELNVGGVRFEIPAFNDVYWNAFSWATFVIPLFEFYNVESAYGKKFTLATREWATDNFATDARVTAVSNRVDDFAALRPTFSESGTIATNTFALAADYALTNATTAAFALSSGQIGNVELGTNLTVTLDFSTAADRSGDCALWFYNTDTATDHTITVAPNTLVVKGFDDGYLTATKATTNLFTFTRVKSNTIIVTKKEVK